VASAPKKEREAAHERVKKALDKVSTQVSLKRTGDRTRCDLYVGNLDFNADCDDLLESIKPWFKRIYVENVSIPPRKGGGNRGYGFIALSWASGAPIDPADLCTQISGRIKVNSRRIYLCEAQAEDTTSDDSESDTGSSAASDCSDSEPDERALACRDTRKIRPAARYRSWDSDDSSGGEWEYFNDSR
jgi:hypothetical protein